MSDPTKRPLKIPSWQVPYFEKHRIFELFHELARELVIQQPDDHVIFLKHILYHAAKNRDTARTIILCPPKINCYEIVKRIAAITKQNVITEKNLLEHSEITVEISNSELQAKRISSLIRDDNSSEVGWILIDCIKNAEDAKALLQIGVLPTHVIHLIPPFEPPLNELLYCNVSSTWPDYRRRILGVRNVFRKVLAEIFMQEKSLDDVIAECVRVLQTKPAKYAIKPRVLILGPRGSGRKTQAKLLASNLNIIYNFERLLCEAWLSSSELSKKLRDCNDKVCLHSDLLVEVVHQRVLQEDCLEHGWVLTGFPFCRKDFEYLDCIHTPPNRVIFIDCELSICRKRILNRRINPLTGSVTNLVEGSEAEHRKTLQLHPKDAEDVVNAEISFYCENYEDIKRYSDGTAHFVNGSQSQRSVYENILTIITTAPLPAEPRKPLQAFSSNTSNSVLDQTSATS